MWWNSPADCSMVRSDQSAGRGWRWRRSGAHRAVGAEQPRGSSGTDRRIRTGGGTRRARSLRGSRERLCWKTTPRGRWSAGCSIVSEGANPGSPTPPRGPPPRAASARPRMSPLPPPPLAGGAALACRSAGADARVPVLALVAAPAPPAPPVGRCRRRSAGKERRAEHQGCYQSKHPRTVAPSPRQRPCRSASGVSPPRRTRGGTLRLRSPAMYRSGWLGRGAAGASREGRRA